MSLQLTDLTHPTREWRWIFLEELAASCNVSSACLAAHVSRQHAYKTRERFPVFRRKWNEAIEVAVEALEYEARRRALDASDPASHVLLIQLLKAHKPRVYREAGHLIPPEAPEPEPDLLTEDALARLSYDDIVALEGLVKKLSGEPEPDPHTR